MNQKSWQHMGRGEVHTSWFFIPGALYFPGIPNKSVKEKNQHRGKSCSFCSPGTIHLPAHVNRLTENCSLPVPVPSFSMLSTGVCSIINKIPETDIDLGLV